MSRETRAAVTRTLRAEAERLNAIPDGWPQSVDMEQPRAAVAEAAAILADAAVELEPKRKARA